MAAGAARADGVLRRRGRRLRPHRPRPPGPDLQLGAIPGPPLPELAPPTQRAVGTLVGAVQVRSRGRVSLASADPAARPLVDPAYFADEADLEVLVAGVRMARELAACRPLAGLTAGELTPGAEAACDPQLRVRGVEGLRVVDASVMPATPRGNTDAPTIAVAERAAHLIRGDTPLAAAAPEGQLVS